MLSRKEFIGWLTASVISFLFFVVTLWPAIDQIERAGSDGYVEIKTRTGKGTYPAHFFLSCPTVALLVAVGCAYKAWRVYQGEE